MLRRMWHVALLCVFSVALSACNWTMFGFDPAHSHFNPVVTDLNTSTVGSMVLKGTATLGVPLGGDPMVVIKGAHGQVTSTVYVALQGGDLYAFDAFGSTNCSGAPASCVPLWVASLGPGNTDLPTPAVANGIVYVGGNDDKLYAFDAAGNTNCTGGPPTKTCTPLWTAAVGFDSSPPTVANGVVYVGAEGTTVAAFDAAGNTNCSGIPKTCAPLWRAANFKSLVTAPAVANGLVYVGSQDGNLYAFDAAGITNCSGTPKTCAPVWTGPTGGEVFSAPAVANGVVYLGSDDLKLYAFDATGNTNCTGGPPTKTCTPLWTATTRSTITASPAVANGVVYAGSQDDDLYAFDAAGHTNCSGTPKTCAPLWTAATGNLIIASPAVENGVVFVGSFDRKLYAFDAAGNIDCTGGPPTKTCTPLWSVTTGGAVTTTPTPAGTVVYFGDNDGKLYAFGLP